MASVLASVVAAGGPAALAQDRPSSLAMTCAEAARFVRARGAAVVGTGGRTYDRFVADGAFCEPDQVARPAFRPTRDAAACLIGYTCHDPGAAKDGG